MIAQTVWLFFPLAFPPNQAVDYFARLTTPRECVKLLYEAHKEGNEEKIRAVWGDPKARLWINFSDFTYKILSVKIAEKSDAGIMKGDAIVTVKISRQKQHLFEHWLQLRKIDGKWHLIAYSSDVDAVP